MTYSQEWDSIYAAGQQITRWPWSELVSTVKRHMPDLRDKRVLELGCGPGANVPFFAGEGALYAGVDGSHAAVEIARQVAIAVRCQSYDLRADDFTKRIPDGEFDLICDRAAVTHNDTDSVRRCLALVYDALKPGGLFVGVDWFSTYHTGWLIGGAAVDDHTISGAICGQFQGVGKVHFSDAEHLRDLFRQFQIIDLRHQIVLDELHCTDTKATFTIVARKP